MIHLNLYSLVMLAGCWYTPTLQLLIWRWELYLYLLWCGSMLPVLLVETAPKVSAVAYANLCSW